MTHVLEYLSTLFHILGLVLLVGGHVWFGLFSAWADRRRDRDGVRFLMAALPLMANGFGVGVLLLFGSGVLKLLLWGEPGLIFLPDPYGWILLGKLLLYIGIVTNGILIERRYLSRVLQPDSTQPVAASRSTVAWTQIKMRARLNLVLILVVLALGEALRYSRL